MTDKELDKKLTAAFDDIQADISVKARIRKGLTGDIMSTQNKNINVNDTIENKGTETAGKAQVRRGGRVAAAAIAGVLAVGGGMFLLKNSFDRVAPSENSSAVGTSYNAPDDDTTTDVQTGTTPADFGGEFDPDGETLYDKFGKNADIWTLKNGRYLIKQKFGDGAEYYDYEGMEHHYFIYDPDTNSVAGNEIVSESPYIRVFGNSIAVWNTIYGNVDDLGTLNSDITVNVYNLDLEPIREPIHFKIQHIQITDIMVSSENKVYLAGVETIDNDNGVKQKLHIMDEGGNTIYNSEEVDEVSCCDIARCGGYIYYGTVTYNNNEPESCTIHTVPIEDGYIETEHTDSRKRAVPMYFDVGNYLYTVTSSDNGDTIVRKADISGKEELEFIQPEYIELDTRLTPENCYATDDGKYLFFAKRSDSKMELWAYDINNNFELVYSTEINDIGTWIYNDGRNVLYEEESGDVCIGGLADLMMTPAARSEEVIRFNVFNGE